MLLLIPCFWQSRLQMSDLESHIYNAWLAELIENGRPLERQPHVEPLALVDRALHVLAVEAHAPRFA